MTRAPQTGEAPPPQRTDTVAVISAYGAFRVLLVLLAIWTFFAGFSLFTQGVGALSFGGHDRSAERIIGAQMIVLVPVYGLLAWRREQYRLLLWVPYAAQLAVILPTLWDLLITRDRDFEDGALMFIVSVIFLVLLIYFWRSSHPLDFFSADEEEEEEYLEEDEELDGDEEPLDDDEEEWDEEEEEQEPGPPPDQRRRR
jgi:hypothetical protein